MSPKRTGVPAEGRRHQDVLDGGDGIDVPGRQNGHPPVSDAQVAGGGDRVLRHQITVDAVERYAERRGAVPRHLRPG